VRGPRPLVICTVAAVGAAVLAVTAALGLARTDISGWEVALYEWMSVPYVVAGLVAWWRRPDSRLGPLMIVGGLVTGLSGLQFADPGVLATIGATLDIIPAALFLHVFLAFPDGHLRSRFERILVAAAYAAAFGLQVLRMSFGAFDNSFQVLPWGDAADTVGRVELIAVTVMLLTGVGVLAVRRRQGGKPRRRSPEIVVDLFALGLLLAAALFVDALLGGPHLQVLQRATWFVIGLAPIVFLFGLLDARLARSAVGDLIIDLRSDMQPASLQIALARTLRDPSLKLAYWLPDFGTYVDLDGRPVDVPAHDGRATRTIEHEGVRVAALLHDPSLDDEPELLDAVGAAAAMALENARLQAELAARLEEVRESRARVLEAEQNERKRLERDLHDGAQQRLVALSLQLKLVERQLSDQPGLSRELHDVQRELAQSLDELRDLARGLHPAVLSAHGLQVALEQVVARAPVPTSLTVDLAGRLPEPIEVAAYFVVSESLANIAKHAGASTASVVVRRSGDAVTVEVDDDGVGGAATDSGSGLRGLADRVEALGGRLRVWSPAGGGTRVLAELPCG
jgi:signal transduction histidine kinase